MSEREMFKSVIQNPEEGVFLGSGQMGVSIGHKSNEVMRHLIVLCLLFVLYFIALARNLRTTLSKGENRSPQLAIIFSRNTFMFLCCSLI